ncbi:MAG TPA: bifunctional methylenetetrahydrofolate dehydrogenase/methenyltetrahydrofolate cyclohydrolase FolD [Flavobacteriaceae bacterium]|nr:bifunctional methylenetetrahydrofolate dehydrogenase/methenyltetrahydrofolate cyclohydrolase FolD [Flavobacteriaceae bacterium]
MTILDGKKTSETIKSEIAQEVEKMKQRDEKAPHLATVIVGDDPASQSYVRSKDRSCKKVGFESTIISLPETISEEKLIAQIDSLNKDENIDGFIVQLPLPKHIDEQTILMLIDPDKDVDGFHPMNFGKMALDMSSFIPATPYGILELLSRYDIPTEGKNTVVIGRSHIVGRPMSILMSRKDTPGNSTVTIAHRHTQNLKEITLKAEIIIVAIGTPNFLTADMVKEGVVVIDVGINRVKDDTAKKGYVLKGDVDFENVKKKASYITPVPGGVGPMTVTMLLKNTLIARQKNKEKSKRSLRF